MTTAQVRANLAAASLYHGMINAAGPSADAIKAGTHLAHPEGLARKSAADFCDQQGDTWCATGLGYVPFPTMAALRFFHVNLGLLSLRPEKLAVLFSTTVIGKASVCSSEIGPPDYESWGVNQPRVGMARLAPASAIASCRNSAMAQWWK
jgi:hypothetical protein